jgi:hypothetical protein
LDRRHEIVRLHGPSLFRDQQPDSGLALDHLRRQRAGRFAQPQPVGTHCTNVNARCFASTSFAASSATAVNPNVQTDYGNIPPNSFWGPGFFNVAAQVINTIPIRESVSFQIGASAFNVLNHPSFAVPNGNVTSGSFGTITSTVSSPTSIYGTGQGPSYPAACWWCWPNSISNAGRKIAMTRLLYVLSIAGALTVQAQPVKLTLEDLLSGEGGRGGRGGGALTPDGRNFVGTANGQITLTPLDGGAAVSFAATGASEMSWSRDGKKMAFVRQGAIWVVEAGGEARRLTEGKAGPGDPRGATDHAPRWNPNGKWILFQSGRRGQRNRNSS